MAADEHHEVPSRQPRTAFEVRHDHRVLHDLGADLLRDIPLVPDGARLLRRAEYLDLHDPARADFRALGDEIVRPGQRLVARSEVSLEAWSDLLDASDRVIGRRPYRARHENERPGLPGRSWAAISQALTSGCCRCC